MKIAKNKTNKKQDNTIYIEARKKFNLSDINFKLLDSFKGKKVSLAATIQYLDLIKPVKIYLKKKQKQGYNKKRSLLSCPYSWLPEPGF